MVRAAQRTGVQQPGHAYIFNKAGFARHFAKRINPPGTAPDRGLAG
jgi:hypothetical protein